MGEVHHVHQPKNQGKSGGDQAVKQAHQKAAGQALNDGFGGQGWGSGRRQLPSVTVIASEAKQSMAPREEGLDCFVASAPRNDEFEDPLMSLPADTPLLPPATSSARLRRQRQPGAGRW